MIQAYKFLLINDKFNNESNILQISKINPMIQINYNNVQILLILYIKLVFNTKSQQKVVFILHNFDCKSLVRDCKHEIYKHLIITERKMLYKINRYLKLYYYNYSEELKHLSYIITYNLTIDIIQIIKHVYYEYEYQGACNIYEFITDSSHFVHEKLHTIWSFGLIKNYFSQIVEHIINKILDIYINDNVLWTKIIHYRVIIDRKIPFEHEEIYFINFDVKNYRKYITTALGDIIKGKQVLSKFPSKKIEIYTVLCYDIFYQNVIKCLVDETFLHFHQQNIRSYSASRAERSRFFQNKLYQYINSSIYETCIRDMKCIIQEFKRMTNDLNIKYAILNNINYPPIQEIASQICIDLELPTIDFINICKLLERLFLISFKLFTMNQEA